MRYHKIFFLRQGCYQLIISAVCVSIALHYAPLEAQVIDDGYIRIYDGPPYPSWGMWGGPGDPDERMFIWNSYKIQLVAGEDNLSSSSMGQRSLALGSHVRPWGDSSVAIGKNVTTYPDVSFAAGENIFMPNSTEAQLGQVAIGYDLYTRQQGAVALGYSSYANGKGAFAVGSANDAKGWGSVAMGFSTVVDLSTTSRGAYAIGYGLIVQDQDAFVVGKYNDLGRGSGDYAFVVGNGTPSQRSDAFWVDKDGNATVKSNLTVLGNIMQNESSLTGGITVNSGGSSFVRTSTTNSEHAVHFEAYLDDESGNYPEGHPAGRIYGTNTIYQDSGQTGNWGSQALVLEATDGWDDEDYNEYQLVLASNGNVGIGKSEPQAKLHVAGDTVIDGTLTVATPSGDISMGAFQ